jgi:hypothetical protein
MAFPKHIFDDAPEPRETGMFFDARFRKALAKPVRAGNADSAIHMQFMI